MPLSHPLPLHLYQYLSLSHSLSLTLSLLVSLYTFISLVFTFLYTSTTRYTRSLPTALFTPGINTQLGGSDPISGQLSAGVNAPQML